MPAQRFAGAGPTHLMVPSFRLRTFALGLLFSRAVRRVEADPPWTSPLSFCCSLVTVGAY